MPAIEHPRLPVILGMGDQFIRTRKIEGNILSNDFQPDTKVLCERIDRMATEVICMSKRRLLKQYATVWDPVARCSVRVHRKRAAEVLGRPLLPGEVVHHLDGNSLNNSPDNLLVMPSQRHHASLEQYLRRARRGQPTLFPDLLEAYRPGAQGTLFQFIL